MKFKIKVNTNGYGIIELGYGLPRIPVKDEVIRIYVLNAKAVKCFIVTGVLWDLDNYEIIIDCCE